MPDTIIETKLIELEKYERKFFDLGKQMFEPGKVYLYPLDPQISILSILQ